MGIQKTSTFKTIRRRIALLALTLGIAVTVSGCMQMTVAIKIHEDEKVDVIIQLQADKSALTQAVDGQELSSAEQYCAELAVAFETYQVKEASETSSQYSCSVALETTTVGLNEDPASEYEITRTGDQFEIVIKASSDLLTEEEQAELVQLGSTLSVTVEFPGEVVSASHGSEINGNHVSWTGWDLPSRDLYATGSAVPVDKAWYKNLSAYQIGTYAGYLILGLLGIWLITKLVKRSRNKPLNYVAPAVVSSSSYTPPQGQWQGLGVTQQASPQYQQPAPQQAQPGAYQQGGYAQPGPQQQPGPYPQPGGYPQQPSGYPQQPGGIPQTGQPQQPYQNPNQG